MWWGEVGCDNVGSGRLGWVGKCMMGEMGWVYVGWR